MNSDQIMKSDILDILFEKRNKLYGAYILRKFYTSRLTVSLGIMLMLATVLCAFTFLPGEKFMQTSGVFAIEDIRTGKIDVRKPVVQEFKQKIKTTAAPASSIPSSKFTNNIVITKNDVGDKLPDNLDQSLISSVTTPGVSGGKISSVDSGKGAYKPIESTKPMDVTTALDEAEIMPSFPGGTEGLRRFLEKNLTNPASMEAGEEISVKVRFVVGFDGKLKSFVIVQNGGEEFNNEVIRVLKKMPQWIPGKSNGQNVSVYTTIPVKFVGAD
ncbi:energy transducer TonB [Ferruginibacter lapsinanis]|uniref:energy transducer TonB n=1 Tax=Ferruginibacter lapsinanis TaxID=563172 RepID=UPI001E4067C7|nr:energy transducer TonB [Ferruginibacter lapsinanis]UEG50024.1 energy transducer TonB [Ferruginibacter lapsinanis]